MHEHHRGITDVSYILMFANQLQNASVESVKRDSVISEKQLFEAPDTKYTFFCITLV